MLPLLAYEFNASFFSMHVPQQICGTVGGWGETRSSHLRRSPPQIHGDGQNVAWWPVKALVVAEARWPIGLSLCKRGGR
jgi:hypothetical protein